MRPIAMKCTREQFDSIKDRIEASNIESFVEYPYICNFYYNKKELVTNTKIPYKIASEHEIHETFDANIFLQACDIEVEKVFKGKELQFKNKLGEWMDCGDHEYRLKPQSNYQKEIEALQQKAKENGMKVIINFEKI